MNQTKTYKKKWDLVGQRNISIFSFCLNCGVNGWWNLIYSQGLFDPKKIINHFLKIKIEILFQYKSLDLINLSQI